MLFIFTFIFTFIFLRENGAHKDKTHLRAGRRIDENKWQKWMKLHENGQTTIDSHWFRRELEQQNGSSSSKMSSWNDTSCETRSFKEVIAAFHTASKSESKKQIRVLVTGAAGFIASHVADYCQTELGFFVVAVDDLSGGFLSNVKQLQERGGLFEQGSVQNVTFIDEVFKKHGPFDYVYHLAAYAAEGLSHFIRVFNYNNNLVASVALLNAAIRQEPQVKTFVFTSSIASYGNSDGKLPLVEESPQRPEDPYGIAKLAFEFDLEAAKSMFGIDHVIFRPHNVYGPRQNIADKFRNAIGIFMNQILRDEDITIFGDGEQRRSFSYIDDVAPLIASSVIFPKALNEGFFVGSDVHYSVNELATEVLHAMHEVNITSKSVIKHLDARNEVALAYATHDKERCFFNPPPTVSLKNGIAITAEFVRSHGSMTPSGYQRVEVPKLLPPSWRTWLDESKSSHDTAVAKELHNSAVTPATPAYVIDAAPAQSHQNQNAPEKKEEALPHVASSGGPSRWRGNNYVRDDGILPYQRCNASDFYPGAAHIYSSFWYNNGQFTLVNTAATVWGESDETGKPISLKGVDLLVYFKRSNKGCKRNVGVHCIIEPETHPQVICAYTDPKTKMHVKVDGIIKDVLGTQPKQMLDLFKDDFKPKDLPSTTIHCPFTDVNWILQSGVGSQALTIELYVGDDKSASYVDLCYEHVEKPDELVVCMQPAFSFHEVGNQFWDGEPPYRYGNLLDFFLIWHHDIHGARIVVNDFVDEAKTYMHKNYRNYNVKYRSDWNMPWLRDFDSYDHEDLCETTCFWENRFRAKWFQIVHAVDNFVLPRKQGANTHTQTHKHTHTHSLTKTRIYSHIFTLTYAGMTVVDIIRTLDAKNISAISVPIVEAYSNQTNGEELGNVLLRWNFLGDDREHKSQHTPIGNPRHISWSGVHWLSGVLPTFTNYLDYEASLSDVVGLQTIHILALARPKLNKREGRKVAYYDQLAQRLENLLEEKYKPKTRSRKTKAKN